MSISTIVTKQPNTTLPIAPSIETYTVLITQSGTSAPTVTVLQNNIKQTPTYSYVDVGKFGLVLPTPIPQNTITAQIEQNDALKNTGIKQNTITSGNVADYLITTADVATNAYENGNLTRTKLTLQIYK